MDAWTLDALWWRALSPLGTALAEEDGPPNAEHAGEPDTVGDGAQRFGLERHLHDFLRDNWDRTTLGREWKIFEEDGEPEAGYEYPTGVGRIDLLAKHRTRPPWLVIELKRGQTSDATVGQIARYMGWVEAHLAEAGEEIQGLVIAQSSDEGLRYALRRVRDVRLQFYEVEFRLKDAGATS